MTAIHAANYIHINNNEQAISCTLNVTQNL